MGVHNSTYNCWRRWTYRLHYSFYSCISLHFFITMGEKGHGRKCLQQLPCHQVNSKEMWPVLQGAKKILKLSCFRRDQKAILWGSELPSSENIQAQAAWPPVGPSAGCLLWGKAGLANLYGCTQHFVAKKKQCCLGLHYQKSGGQNRDGMLYLELKGTICMLVLHSGSPVAKGVLSIKELQGYIWRGAARCWRGWKPCHGI